jgi:hypothetical protein
MAFANSAATPAPIMDEVRPVNFGLVENSVRNIVERVGLFAPLYLAMAVPCGATVGSEFNGPNLTPSSHVINYGRRYAQPIEVERSRASSEVSGVHNWIYSVTDFADAGLCPAIASACFELSQLRDGWNGDQSRAPSGYVYNDLWEIGKSIPHHAVPPEVEVDDDGSVALRWDTDTHFFALTLQGNGRVTGTMYPRSAGIPAQFSVSDRNAILEFMDRDDIKQLIS